MSCVQVKSNDMVSLQAMDGEKCVGAVVCKLDMHKNMIRRGYIAMLAVEKEYRRHKIGELCLTNKYLILQTDISTFLTDIFVI